MGPNPISFILLLLLLYLLLLLALLVLVFLKDVLFKIGILK